MAVTKATLDEIALSQAEYELILERLDREPNSVELGMFGALWSEHCGYKHSKPLLRLFSQESSRVLSQTGAENAGAVDIGGGLAVDYEGRGARSFSMQTLPILFLLVLLTGLPSQWTHPA